VIELEANPDTYEHSNTQTTSVAFAQLLFLGKVLSAIHQGMNDTIA
jgi:hypothetical protein